jgi:glycosyltransferase involved in cell wall biosynthesis
MVSLVNGFLENASDFYLISNSENLGAGSSRNKGVKQSKGDLIFFLDGDDLFLEDHIFHCVKVMIDHQDIHFVKTKIRIDETIHPYWRSAIENSVPINVCVRRWCHDFIGGFPEHDAFNVLRCEDVVYNSSLSKFLVGNKIEKETVHHFRYPGNALDRQMKKFSKAPTPTAFMDALNDAERSVWPEIKAIMDKNQQVLEQSLNSWNKHLSSLIPK